MVLCLWCHLWLCVCVRVCMCEHTTTHCNTLLPLVLDTLSAVVGDKTHCNTLRHIATHCDTLQHTATPCNTLQHTATQCITLPNTRTSRFGHTICCCGREDALQHTPTHCNTRRHTATHCNTLSLLCLGTLSAGVGDKTHCSTPQQAATHCNTLQPTATQSYFCAHYLLVVLSREEGFPPM